MEIKSILNRLFKRNNNILVDKYNSYTGCTSLLTQEAYGRAIFISIAELLTSLVNDVTFLNKKVTKKAEDFEAFAMFNAFFNNFGQMVLTKLMLEGYVVIGKSALGLKLLNINEYKQIGTGEVIFVEAIDKELYTECYVMRSSLYEVMGVSDFQLVSPFVRYLDNSLNASNTALERLGSLVIASPKTPSNLPTVVTLSKEQKDALEKEIETEYGALSKQKQIMVLPREMDFQTLSLASLDLKTNDRVRVAILAICDRLKVPANQVAIIDANSSKSLSNGSELREGDFNKYQSFERLLNQTFVKMALAMNLNVDYTIYNKPSRQ